MERLRKAGSELVYRCGKQSEPRNDYTRGAKVDKLHLTPLELIHRIAALVPPPHPHRHRYFGVLAPNSPLRSAVTAMAAAPAQPASAARAQRGSPAVSLRDVAHCPTQPGYAGVNQPAPDQTPAPPKRATHYLWAVLIARIYEAFPLGCPLCGGQMRIIVFINHSPDIRKILDHIRVDSEPPHITPARGPPLWDACDAQADEGRKIGPAWDLAAQLSPDFEVDQRVDW